MSKILQPGKKYTFSDYFDLNYPTREIVAEFGYTYRLEEIEFPKPKTAIAPLDRLRQTYRQKLPFISLTSEAAKREFYIAPLLLELLDYIRAEIDVEYPIDAGENLSGTIDYLLRSRDNFIVIEAKKGDLEKGFNQLAIELIAVAIAFSQKSPLYGAVTLGDVWRFGVLDPIAKTLTKDINAYTLLPDLEAIVSILVGVLEHNESGTRD